ncbi:LysR family glycine cleavage system transcriptional activator [Herbaspirillum sp. Sphag1AN]|uniref:transcriptional regulator GcvA n=1 Tax=unclassified Herbaspirillum TaxID=2624150 RepID=UPI00160BCC34|nr:MULTISPECIES: transcriptional regulator GcvA [unclassified Herbaspirillum]MBB3214539.1 LysR family glycine cleavage system transcriptional activator [Herbaspirillum sp. Sphag1AN]MBB3247621.1 LysR family glycine cleavage system transcriptional activator [Herbaspirillum sp. Sphag64]
MADLRKLPNLAALRAFEAAARHESFSRAAEEIHVTPGAISHQIRALEEELNVQLFNRYGKRIAVTVPGRRFAEVIRKSLGEIADLAVSLQEQCQQRLVVTAPPSFASRWLASRLWKFIDRHANIEVILQSSNQISDLAREGIDVGLRFGKGNYPGLKVERLLEDYYYPVVSPQYRGGQLPASPQALRDCTLLRMDNQEESWQPWFALAGLDMPDPSGGLVTEDSSLTLRAAADGAGVALTHHAIASQEIAAGELVRLFDIAWKSDHSYYFCATPMSFAKPQVQLFLQWLREEAVAFMQHPLWPGESNVQPAQK